VSNAFFDGQLLDHQLFEYYSHEAGVCSLHHHPHIPHLLASGSYDEQLRIWDNRKMKEPLQSIGLDGGVCILFSLLDSIWLLP
jgi:WD40 repeat protein